MIIMSKTQAAASLKVIIITTMVHVPLDNLSNCKPSARCYLPHIPIWHILVKLSTLNRVLHTSYLLQSIFSINSTQSISPQHPYYIYLEIYLPCIGL